MEVLSKSEIRTYVRTFLSLLFLALLLYALYSVISPFLGVFTFAIIFAVSFHKFFEKHRGKAGKYTKLPAIIYAILMVSLVAIPFIFLLGKLGNVLHGLTETFGEIREGKVPALPMFIQNIPYLGEKATAMWTKLEADPAGTVRLYEDQIRYVLQHLISGGTGIMGAGMELVLGIIVSAVLLHYGKSGIEPIAALFENLLGVDTSQKILDASGKAIRGVAIGVMGTGLIAALAAWIGFAIAGIGFAGMLAAITFFLVVIQIGPLLVWLPVALWLGHEGHTGTAIFVTVWGIVVLMGIDNILKPILIGKSGKLPILVLFLGVVGGMAAWGFTGMFKGAIVLAIFYTLVRNWTIRQEQEEKPVAAEPPGN